MKKETTALAKAIENLIVACLPVLTEAQPVPAPVSPSVVPPQAAQVIPPVAAAPPAPVAPAPVAPAPVAPAPVVPVAGPVTHDEVRAHLLPIIQSNQNAMTAVHGVLTGQFAVNELTSLPVATIPAFMQAVEAALAAIPK
jgi:hypothetical protein